VQILIYNPRNAFTRIPDPVHGFFEHIRRVTSSAVIGAPKAQIWNSPERCPVA
jgi:hypothetical protein